MAAHLQTPGCCFLVRVEHDMHGLSLPVHSATAHPETAGNGCFCSSWSNKQQTMWCRGIYPSSEKTNFGAQMTLVACFCCCRWLVDWLDQRVPTLVEWMLWLMSQISLVLHVITVGVNLGVIWVSPCSGSLRSADQWPKNSACMSGTVCGSTENNSHGNDASKTHRFV